MASREKPGLDEMLVGARGAFAGVSAASWAAILAIYARGDQLDAGHSKTRLALGLFALGAIFGLVCFAKLGELGPGERPPRPLAAIAKATIVGFVCGFAFLVQSIWRPGIVVVLLAASGGLAAYRMPVRLKVEPDMPDVFGSAAEHGDQ